MRQIFTSPRIENVEAVARWLDDAGIQTTIRNGRGWKGAIRGNFSYRDPPGRADHPSVWVIRAEDQPKARAMLREEGLLQTTRAPDMTYLPASMHDRTASTAGRRLSRVNLMLVVIIAAVAGLTLFGARRMGWWPEAAPVAPAGVADLPAPAAGLPITVDPAVHRIAVPPLLANTLVARWQSADTLCMTIDGTDPPADSLQQLQASHPHVVAASQCPATADATQVDVFDYRTDGSGQGTVRMQVEDGTAVSTHEYAVQRLGNAWRVVSERNVGDASGVAD